MIGRTNAGGGGGGLNFKVVGGTAQPKNPKENTIWVNTDTEISSWVFSATEPESPVEGMVWIATSKSSPVEFNAVRKNGIFVYPVIAMQYVSGAFLGKTASIYQNNKWNILSMLYSYGNQCDKMTGGWTKRGIADSSNTKIGNVTFNDDNMQLSAISGDVQGFVYASTKNLIDLTNNKSVYFRVPSYISTGYPAVLSIHSSSEKWDLSETTRVAVTRISEAGVYSVDVSALSGSYYVAAMIYTNNTSTYTRLTINEVWLE